MQNEQISQDKKTHIKAIKAREIAHTQNHQFLQKDINRNTYLEAIHFIPKKGTQKVTRRRATNWRTAQWVERAPTWRINAEKGNRNPQVIRANDAIRVHYLFQETQTVWIGRPKTKIWDHQDAKN